jgi:glycosyltransferase involved in cell wall biosynthesis
VPPAQEQALAAAIGELHDDPVLARRLGENAVVEAAASHSWDARMEALLSHDR